MVLYIQKYGMQTMNIMKQEKRASLPGGARRFGFVCSFSFEMFWEERMAKYVMALDAGTTSNRCIDVYKRQVRNRVSGSYPMGRPVSVPSVCRKRRFPSW